MNPPSAATATKRSTRLRGRAPASSQEPESSTETVEDLYSKTQDSSSVSAVELSHDPGTLESSYTSHVLAAIVTPKELAQPVPAAESSESFPTSREPYRTQSNVAAASTSPESYRTSRDVSRTPSEVVDAAKHREARPQQPEVFAGGEFDSSILSELQSSPQTPSDIASEFARLNIPRTPKRKFRLEPDSPYLYILSPVGKYPEYHNGKAIGPKVPHTLIHLWMDAAPEDLSAPQPVNPCTFAFAVPSSSIANLFAQYRPIAVALNPALTQTPTAVQTTPPLNKRKVADDAEMSEARRVRYNKFTPRTAKIGKINPRQSLRSVFASSRREALQESTLQGNAGPSPQNTDMTPSAVQKKVNHYDKDGSLQLVKTPEPVDPDEEEEEEEEEPVMLWDDDPLVPGVTPLSRYLPKDMKLPAELSEASGKSDHVQSQLAESTESLALVTIPEEQQQAPAPATPRPRAWGLGSLRNSVRSVTRLLPGFRRHPQELASTTAQQPLTQVPQTAPHQSSHTGLELDVPATAQASKDGQKRQVKQGQKSFRTKAEIEAGRERRAQRIKRNEEDFIASQAQFVAKPQKSHRPAWLESSVEGLTMKQRRRLAEGHIVSVERPGHKRKRRIFPEKINGRNSSGGFCLPEEAFGYASSHTSDEDDSSDEDDVDSPSRQRPSKRSRGRSLTRELPLNEFAFGDPHRARPYTGKAFHDPQDGPYVARNVFNLSAEDREAAAKKRQEEEQEAVEQDLQRKVEEFREMERTHGIYRGTPQPSKKHPPPPLRSAMRSTMATPRPAPSITPTQITNLSGRFAVPSPSEDDSEDEESTDEIGPKSPVKAAQVQHRQPTVEAEEELRSPIGTAERGDQRNMSQTTSANIETPPTAQRPSTEAIASQKSPAAEKAQPTIVSKSTANERSATHPPPTSTSNESDESWTQPPPPPPNPSHARLPGLSYVQDPAALEQARSKALQYQPSKPSRLRPVEFSDDEGEEAAEPNDDGEQADNESVGADAEDGDIKIKGKGKEVYTPASVEDMEMIDLVDYIDAQEKILYEEMGDEVKAVLMEDEMECEEADHDIAHEEFMRDYNQWKEEQSAVLGYDVTSKFHIEAPATGEVFTISPNVAEYVDDQWSDRDTKAAEDDFALQTMDVRLVEVEEL